MLGRHAGACAARAQAAHTYFMHAAASACTLAEWAWSIVALPVLPLVAVVAVCSELRGGVPALRRLEAAIRDVTSHTPRGQVCGIEGGAHFFWELNAKLLEALFHGCVQRRISSNDCAQPYVASAESAQADWLRHGTPLFAEAIFLKAMPRCHHDAAADIHVRLIAHEARTVPC